jgi:predicted signal transduction protein with EAL and GGDEF domain
VYGTIAVFLVIVFAIVFISGWQARGQTQTADTSNLSFDVAVGILDASNASQRPRRSGPTRGLPGAGPLAEPVAQFSQRLAPQFEREDNFERLMQIVHESGLPTDRLELEITERTALRDIDHTRELATRITETGIRLSIDDFGAGSTSLRYLRDLPLSTLKIDQAFILTLGENPANAAIAASVVSLGHKLNLNVIAEGVETLEQLEVLRSQDCDEFQGFLASRPVPPEDFRAIVDADRPMVADPA